MAAPDRIETYFFHLQKRGRPHMAREICTDRISGISNHRRQNAARHVTNCVCTEIGELTLENDFYPVRSARQDCWAQRNDRPRAQIVGRTPDKASRAGLLKRRSNGHRRLFRVAWLVTYTVPRLVHVSEACQSLKMKNPQKGIFQ